MYSSRVYFFPLELFKYFLNLQLNFLKLIFEIVILRFFFPRCRFSQMLHPIFEEASNVIKEEYPDKNQVVFARVDCDQHCK